MGMRVDPGDLPVEMPAEVPEFFCTTMVQAEGIAGGCVRFYCAVKRSGAWHVTGCVIMPIDCVPQAARASMQAAAEQHNLAQFQNVAMN